MKGKTMKRTKRYALLSLCLLSSCSSNLSSLNESSPKDSSFHESSSQNESSEIVKTNEQRVVIIGIDGAGHSFNESNTPHIMEIFKDYAYTNEALSANPTISAQSWGSLLTGVAPTLHEFTNASIASTKNQIYLNYPSIFLKTKEAYPNATLASFCNWNPINYGIIEDHIQVHKETSNNDDDLAEKIINYLVENDPKLLFVQFDSVDEAGHAYGYQSDAYFSALKNLDENVQAIFHRLSTLNRLEDTLFIVTTDHGGIGQGHGGYSDAEKYIFLGVRGKNIANTTMDNLYIRDIPSIVAHHLQFEADSSWDSFIPIGLFKDFMEGNRRMIPLTLNEVNTPIIYGSQGLYQYFQEEQIKLRLNFDYQFEDEKKDYEIISRKTPSYQKGITGQSILVTNEKDLTIKDLKLNNESFTISTFVNIENSNGDPCLFSNKNWASGTNDGICFSLRDNDMKFNIGQSGQNRFDAVLHYPNAYYKQNWMHLLISYNALTRRLSFYVNFSLEYTALLPENLQFDSSYPFRIGQDGTGNYSLKLEMLIDDFMIFNSPFEKNDVQTLKTYYLNCL